MLTLIISTLLAFASTTTSASGGYGVEDSYHRGEIRGVPISMLDPR